MWRLRASCLCVFKRMLYSFQLFSFLCVLARKNSNFFSLKRQNLFSNSFSLKGGGSVIWGFKVFVVFSFLIICPVYPYFSFTVLMAYRENICLHTKMSKRPKILKRSAKNHILIVALMLKCATIGG